MVRYNPYLAELAENKVQDDGGPVVLQVSIYFFFFDLFEGQISQKKGLLPHPLPHHMNSESLPGLWSSLLRIPECQ